MINFLTTRGWIGRQATQGRGEEDPGFSCCPTTNQHVRNCSYCVAKRFCASEPARHCAGGPECHNGNAARRLCGRSGARGTRPLQSSNGALEIRRLGGFRHGARRHARAFRRYEPAIGWPLVPAAVGTITRTYSWTKLQTTRKKWRSTRDDAIGRMIISIILSAASICRARSCRADKYRRMAHD